MLFDAQKSPDIKVSLKDLHFTNTDNEIYFRVTAVDAKGRLCSDATSDQNFYRFLRRGSYIV